MTDVQSIIDNLRDEKQAIITVRNEIPDDEYERIDPYLAAEGRIDQAIEELQKGIGDE